MNYEDEWEENEEDGEDIGGIWQVVKGRRMTKREQGQEWTGRTSRRTYENRWEALAE